jgi:hypothetical protein
MQEEHQEEVAKLRALQSFTTWVQDLVLKGSDGTSSLAVLLSSAVDLIEGRIDVVAINGAPLGGLIGAKHHLVARS